jgi:hypothetical protein
MTRGVAAGQKLTASLRGTCVSAPPELLRVQRPRLKPTERRAAAQMKVA